MKKSLILLLCSAVLALTACQAANPATPTTSPTQAVQIPAVQNAYPSANQTAPAAAYPAATNPDESNSTMGAYPSPNVTGATGEIGSAFPPADADAGMTRGNFQLDSASLQTSADKPGQADLMGSGSLPTPCNQLRVKLNPPDAQNKIVVEVYSVVAKDKNCTQNLSPFQGRFATLGGYPSGKYTVVINDKPAGELTVP